MKGEAIHELIYLCVCVLTNNLLRESYALWEATTAFSLFSRIQCSKQVILF